MILDVQFNAATTSWPAIRDGARAAEDAGFGAVWVFDHLAGSSLRGTTSLEMFTLLGALAASTERIPLGSMVANVYNREPGVLAVGAASVEAIGDRQVFLGIGAGASPTSRWAAEQHAAGHRMEPVLAARHARVERVLTLCSTMWSPARPPELATFPLPGRRPELHVGAGSVALAAVAGRLADGVNVGRHAPHRDAMLAAALAARVQAHGSVDGFVRSVWSPWDEELFDPASPAHRELAEAGVDRLIVIASVDRVERLPHVNIPS